MFKKRFTPQEQIAEILAQLDARDVDEGLLKCDQLIELCSQNLGHGTKAMIKKEQKVIKWAKDAYKLLEQA